MKTFKLFPLLIALMLMQSLQAQDCNFAFKDGGKLTSTAYSWTNPYVYDPKFQKLKDEKKDELIASYNADVLSGKIAPSGTYPYTFTVKKNALASGATEYILTTNIAGKDYSSFLVCKGDTLFSYRNKGPVLLNDANGKELGFTIQDPQKMPLNLKVGDKLPTFNDISFLYPTTSETRTKYVQVVEDYMVIYSLKALETLSFSSHTIHYMFAEVTGEEELVFAGTKYKAYTIESQTWTKGKMDMSVVTAYRDVNEACKKGMDKTMAKAEKMMVKKGVTNELGYMVSYLKEWYVPQLGIVKTETYDKFGGIAGGSLTTSIE